MFGLQLKNYAQFLKQQLESNPMIERFEFNEEQYQEIKELIQAGTKEVSMNFSGYESELQSLNHLKRIVEQLDKMSGFFRHYRAVDRVLLVKFIGSTYEF
jgi:DNA-directed RNA polymerase specialized sigma54-like protein